MRLFFIFLLSSLCFSAAHKDMRGAQVHTAYRWVFNDSTARNAQSVAVGDTDCMAYQKSDSTIWILRDNSPKRWIKLNSDRYFDTTISVILVSGGPIDTVQAKLKLIDSIVTIHILSIAGTCVELLGTQIIIPAKFLPVQDNFFVVKMINDGLPEVGYFNVTSGSLKIADGHANPFGECGIYATTITYMLR